MVVQAGVHRISPPLERARQRSGEAHEASLVQASSRWLVPPPDPLDEAYVQAETLLSDEDAGSKPPVPAGPLVEAPVVTEVTDAIELEEAGPDPPLPPAPPDPVLEVVVPSGGMQRA